MKESKKIYRPYPEEKYPENILYLKDNPNNRQILLYHFPKPKWLLDNYAYIEFDINTKTWENTPDFRWMYTNQPPLTDIKKIIKKYSTKK